jgi:hypothetical protein
LNDGGLYTPGGNKWTATTTSGAPTGRYYHTAVWTGSEMIVWGGSSSGGDQYDTWSYTPAQIMVLYQKK